VPGGVGVGRVVKYTGWGGARWQNGIINYVLGGSGEGLAPLAGLPRDHLDRDQRDGPSDGAWMERMVSDGRMLPEGCDYSY
jgi:hypothetical protein